MAAKTKEQKDAEAAALAEQQQENGLPEKSLEEQELSDEELKAQSDKINAAREAKIEADKKARIEAEGKPGGEKMYSESQMEEIVRRILAKNKAESGSQEDIDEEELYAQKKIRLPRFQNKFILGFKNVNQDEYFPELTVQAFDIWDDQSKRMVAWVTVLFNTIDENTQKQEELTVPLYTVLTKSSKVWCDLVEIVPTDKSYSNGRVEQMDEVKDYNQKGTGTFTKLKVKVNEYQFKIKLPGTNEVVTVGPEVVNW